MEFWCARILLISHWFGVSLTPAEFIDKSPRWKRGLFLVRPIYTTPALWLAGFGPANDRFAQAFHQPFQVRHAFAECPDRSAQFVDLAAQCVNVLPHPASRSEDHAASATPTATMVMISGVMLPPNQSAEFLRSLSSLYSPALADSDQEGDRFA